MNPAASALASAMAECERQLQEHKRLCEEAEVEIVRLRGLVSSARLWVLNAVDPLAVGQDTKQMMLDTLRPLPARPDADWCALYGKAVEDDLFSRGLL